MKRKNCSADKVDLKTEKCDEVECRTWELNDKLHWYPQVEPHSVTVANCMSVKFQNDDDEFNFDREFHSVSAADITHYEAKKMCHTFKGIAKHHCFALGQLFLTIPHDWHLCICPLWETTTRSLHFQYHSSKKSDPLTTSKHIYIGKYYCHCVCSVAYHYISEPHTTSLPSAVYPTLVGWPHLR